MSKLCAIIWLLFLPAIGAKSLIIQTGECNFSRKYYENFTLSIVNNSVSMDMITIRKLQRGIKVFIDFEISLGNSKNYQRVFAHIIDVCGIVSSVRNNIFKSWFESMLQHGNFMYNCPVTEGHYFLHDWKLDSRLVPHYLNVGDYRIKSHFFYGKQKSKHEDFVLDIIVYAQLKPS
ncbi:uncharacterized protein LOC111519522 [Drosophila willistoni]|uniref:uncharacterized protein LOC111519522 n=1 Tax=Drosophila willistoni TaxID=7260 RepID=UPI000C26D377|nr:uncharacterized protein LOC111519522 [Drosophila willistoni]